MGMEEIKRMEEDVGRAKEYGEWMTVGMEGMEVEGMEGDGVGIDEGVWREGK